MEDCCYYCEYVNECRVTDVRYCHSWTPNEEWCRRNGIATGKDTKAKEEPK